MKRNDLIRHPADKNDSPYDTPATVNPIKWYNYHRKENKHSNNEVYIWREADSFWQNWLNDNGYYIYESDILKDCIGYLCTRNGYEYAVYMYAYGNKKTALLDGEYCEKLKKHPYAKDRTILIVYLNVKRFKNGDEVSYGVYCYTGDEDDGIELRRLNEIKGKPVIEYYPRKEMIDRTYELMYAFNHSSLDVYDDIICKDNPSFSPYDSPGIVFNDAVHFNLLNLHKKYGFMKIGYVRYNDVVYSEVPYLKRYGFFGFSVDAENRINRIYSYPFDGGERPVAEFIKTRIRENEDMYSHIPKLVMAEPMDPVMYERFAVKLLFDNGESRKYVLPIDTEEENNEVVQYYNHVFTDKIWSSVGLVSSAGSECSGYPQRGQAIRFKNGFSLSVHYCYQNSKAYEEPTACNDIVYEDDEIKVNRLWKWNANAMYQDEETGIIKVLLDGTAFNFNGVSTFATSEGVRLTSLDFDYISDFREGLAVVGISGRGYGYIDTSGKIVIPAQYEKANDFSNGRASVMKNGIWYFIDGAGKKIPTGSTIEGKYKRTGEFCEGMCRVSLLDIDFEDLAYYSDNSGIAGVWGYVDETGKEVIPPQYIYAEDFNDGIAIVCKGEWTKNEKWNNRENSDRYWTEEELWGAIDKTGKEVIPCIFNEIRRMQDTPDVFAAHIGDLDDGKWGIIDRTGKWIVEPVFYDVGYEYNDDLFIFYEEAEQEKDELIGIYDAKQKRVLLEPQFQYVTFIQDGNIRVEVYDELLNRSIEKIINRNGEELFESIYSSIHTWSEPYEVIINDENGSRHGLIDKKGNVILPCKYYSPWNGVCYDKRRVIYECNGKQGLIDFDDNVIVPAVYNKICGLENPLFTVRYGDKDNYLEGLIKEDGTMVIPPEYEQIKWYGKECILCDKLGECEFLQLVYK